MPQIKLIFNPLALNLIVPSTWDNLKRGLRDAVENSFLIAGRNDVAFTFLSAMHTDGEAPLQIEVLYTAGTDEYGTGTIFDPDDAMKEAATKALRAHFAAFLKEHGMGAITPSVWIRPQYKSHFVGGVVEK